MSKQTSKTRTMVGVALFTAIVVVLQLLSSTIHFGPFSITLALIPIVVGAALYGVAAGAWLGLAFGLTVLLSGDAAPFLAVNVLGTILTVLLKGAAAGACAGLIYKALNSKNDTVAITLGALSAPIANTGVFLLGCLAFFMPTLRQWMGGTQFESVGAYMIFGLVGINFLVELGTIVVLSPVIHRLIAFGKKKLAGRIG
ncbi:MAG: ECF transporter S component [Oscillospiraceae bacterium]|nr:ECF transporter S component [Oscillospiraceae bacterium]